MPKITQSPTSSERILRSRPGSVLKDTKMERTKQKQVASKSSPAIDPETVKRKLKFPRSKITGIVSPDKRSTSRRTQALLAETQCPVDSLTSGFLQLHSRGHTSPQLEVCIDNVNSGVAAEEGGAKRIELCSALSEGGLTPSVGFLKMMTRLLKIPIFPMIRPRGGDFLYSTEEIQIMKEDIRILRAHGASGFVFGVLDQQGRIDEAKCAELLRETGSLPVTFHRAFDLTPSPAQALDVLIKLGFKRVLTSGQQSTAIMGKYLIRDLVEQADGRITILAGAGVTPENVNELIEFTGIREVHASCKVKTCSAMEMTNQNVSMGADTDEMNIFVASKEIVSTIVANIQQF